ncbi:RNA polymerase sigma factor SigM [Nocardioides albidus]|uniref:RNA polymerase sigma factor SigM n=1 Tax=Nocardioides albidus TaxID=1517589 RepID=A0A5C4VR94_9ACTN|nr:RNA polymerase sigma factor SigM [Nocardioides albidus]TNM38422.1 RNA polymerase sigma factor SigM [Nocardioides albidus]
MSEPSEREHTDRELLAAHVAGDPAAFGVLVTRHRDRLWAVALRTCGHPGTAADGLQEGLVSAFRRAGTFRGDAAVTTWLHRVVVNACLDRLRAGRVRRTEPLPEDLDELDSGHRRRETPAEASAADPAEHGLVVERRERVLAALRTLPAEQRAAIVLVDMEGYPVAEAARILDCAEGTVKSRCSRGRARLAAELGDLLEVGDSPDGPDGPDATEESGKVRPAEDARNPSGPPDVGSVTPRGPPAGTAVD